MRLPYNLLSKQFDIQKENYSLRRSLFFFLLKFADRYCVVKECRDSADVCYFLKSKEIPYVRKKKYIYINFHKYNAFVIQT